MQGVYSLKSIAPKGQKYVCMVSFNGKDPEAYEVESPNDVGNLIDENGKEVLDENGLAQKAPLPGLNAEFVAGVLQTVADEDYARINAEPVPVIALDANGQIVL